MINDVESYCFAFFVENIELLSKKDIHALYPKRATVGGMNKIRIVFTLVIVVCFALTACDQGSTSKTDDSPPSSPTLTLDFVYGEDGTSSYGNIYVAWIEDMEGAVIQNLCICRKLLDDMEPPSTVLTNTALPYWNEFKYDPSQIDGVSGATIAKKDFSVTGTLKDPSVTKFKVCFETDRSFDKNDWFGDQPALLYSTVVDLDNPQTSYDLTLEAWTPNEGTLEALKNYVGTLPFGSRQTDTRFITHKKAASTPPDYAFGAEDRDQSSTCFVRSVTVKVE